MENNSLPNYKTRKFWAVVISVLVFAWTAYLVTFNQFGFSELVFASLGTTMYELVGFNFASKMGANFAILIYLLTQAFLLRKTFGQRIVKQVFPISSIMLFIVGIIGLFLYAGSF
jgi:hypothetical protein